LASSHGLGTKKAKPIKVWPYPNAAHGIERQPSAPISRMSSPMYVTLTRSPK
jgi:hypothetical protein